LVDIWKFLGVYASVRPTEQRVFEHDYEKPLDPKLRMKLTDIFKSDIHELERLIGRDLSRWYQPNLVG
jgi:hypothetical protein